MKFKYLILVAVLIAGGIGYYFMTPKGDINIEKAKVDYHLTATNLFSSFSEDETISTEKYVSNIIQLSGILVDVQEIESGLQLRLDSGSLEGNVSCNLQKNSTMQLSDFKIGDSISVKGICTGFLFDVILDQCIIIKT